MTAARLLDCFANARNDGDQDYAAAFSGGVFEISQGGKSRPTEEELACPSACKG